VVDVLSETDSNDSNRRDHHADVNLYRWHKQNLRFFTPAETEIARRLETDEDTEFHPELEVPVHPLVPCFDLKRHVRLRVHVNNLEKYEYREDMAQNLV